MLFKLLLVSSFVVTGLSLTGCAAETSDGSRDESDALALTDDSTQESSNVEIARLESSRGCTSAEVGIAQQHANDNHTIIVAPGPFSGTVSYPTVTSCHVSNGWIVYTYNYN